MRKSNILTKYQSGFRKGQASTDQLIRLESFIRDSFLKGNHVVAVFFDLEKAYNTVWTYGVIRDYGAECPCLFRIFYIINSIADGIPSSFEKSLFVDDFSISYSSRNMA